MKRHPKDRAQELSNTIGVPTPFEVVGYVSSNQSDELERKMHSRLKEYRSNKNREFFKYPVRNAIKLLNKLCADFSLIEQPIPFEREAVKSGLEIRQLPPNNSEVSSPEELDDFTPDLYKVSSKNSMPKLGINGSTSAIPDNLIGATQTDFSILARNLRCG